MTTRFTKTLAGIAAAATLAVSAVALSSPAQAHWHGGWGHGWHGWGGPFVIGSYYDYPNCSLVNVYSKSGRYLRTVQRCY
ncbi:MAG: sulfur globule protein precursor [Bradyrhizobiaceae bacterium]|nr:sulfur globule protein precursor [Hyphomicrobiales bacterium]MBV9428715.1 sulfur globule protein precursor [Bradyrhizobiaceae bacterium]